MSIEVIYQGLSIAKDARIRLVDGGIFVHLEGPMPVATPLALRSGDHTLSGRVRRVKEGDGSGMLIAPAAGSRLPRWIKQLQPEIVGDVEFEPEPAPPVVTAPAEIPEPAPTEAKPEAQIEAHAETKPEAQVETKPEAKPDEAKPDETKVEAKPDEAKPDETKVEAKPDEAKPDEAKVETKSEAESQKSPAPEGEHGSDEEEDENKPAAKADGKKAAAKPKRKSGSRRR